MSINNNFSTKSNIPNTNETPGTKYKKKKRKTSPSVSIQNPLKGPTQIDSPPPPLKGKACTDASDNFPPMLNIVEKVFLGNNSEHSTLSLEKQGAIASLQYIEDPQRPLETSDPLEFFKEFTVPIDTIITGNDIITLQNLFEKYKFSDSICFYDLFGLEFYNIISNSLLPSQKKLELIKEWAAIYLSGYIGIFRLFYNDSLSFSEETRTYFRMPSNYITKLVDFGKKFHKEIQEYGNELKKNTLNSPEKIDEENKKIADTRKRWTITQLLITKLFNNDPLCSLLIKNTISVCPGSEKTVPRSKEEVFIALKNLADYCYIIQIGEDEAAKKGEASFNSTYFEEIYEKILAITRFETMEEPLSGILKIETFIHEKIKILNEFSDGFWNNFVQAGKNKLTHQEWCKNNKISIVQRKSKKEFEEFLLRNFIHSKLLGLLCKDIISMIENDILPNLNPSYKMPLAYLNRINLNLQTLKFLEKDSPIFPVEHTLKDLKAGFEAVFVSKPMENSLKKIFDSLQTEGFSLSLLNDPLEDMHRLLKPLIEQALEVLLHVKEEDCGDISLSQKTIWLSQIFILFNDIEVLLKIREQSENIIPDSFLNFLILNQKQPSSNLDAIENTQIEKSFSEMLIPSTPPPEEEKLPSLSSLPSSEAPSSEKKIPISAVTSKKKKSKPVVSEKEELVKKESKPVMSAKEELVESILRSRKVRQIETILTELGFTEERVKGSHCIWKAKNGGQTVVSRHKEIDKYGTLKAIHDQVSSILKEDSNL